jgi:hypothetical protein
MSNNQIDTLREMLRDLFSARYKGVPYARLARAHGYVDGYMAALLRSKELTQRDLLALIAEERTRVAGPSTKVIPRFPASAAVPVPAV